MDLRPGRFRRAGRAVLAAVLLALLVLTGCGRADAAAPSPAAVPATAPAPAPGDKPTIVLVHGAFADASSWSKVVTQLQQQGYPVVAPALWMRGLASDSDYLRGLLTQITGPVILAGHSYAGAVISNAATGMKNVRALVFVNAYAPDQGEVLGMISKGSKDSVLNPALLQQTYPTDGPKTATELVVDPVKFPAIFAADLPAAEAAELAATQRPIAAAGFAEPAGPPAWRSIPSWAVVATGDKAAGTDVTLAEAKRAGAQITEVDASHLVMLSRPDVVTAVIVQAVRGTA